MNEILKYEPIVLEIVSEMGKSQIALKTMQKQDLIQECYSSLLENLNLAANDGEEKVREICRASIYAALRNEKGSHFVGRGKNRKRIESFSDPKIWSRVMEIPSPSSGSVTESELQEAILKLDWEDYRVIYSLYIDGRTLEQTMADLGLTKKAVRVRQARGIRSLKKHFEVVA